MRCCSKRWIIGGAILLPMLVGISLGGAANDAVVTRVYPVGDLLAKSAARTPDEALTDLVSLITNTIQRGRWVDRPGRRAIEESVDKQTLVISAPPAVHHELTTLLTYLRQFVVPKSEARRFRAEQFRGLLLPNPAEGSKVR